MIIAKDAKPTGGSFDPIPEDNHVVTCYQVIDLGTQKEVFQGKEKLQRKIRIVFETPNLRKEFKHGEGEKPYSISKEYTLSLAEKSNLRKDLQSWRGKPFTEEELEGFDIARLLGKSCLAQIIHKTTPNGTYAMIQTISKIPSGMAKVDKVYNATMEFSIDEFSQEKFELLPEYMQNKIRESQEWKEGIIPPKPRYIEGANTEETVF